MTARLRGSDLSVDLIQLGHGGLELALEGVHTDALAQTLATFFMDRHDMTAQRRPADRAALSRTRTSWAAPLSLAFHLTGQEHA